MDAKYKLSTINTSHDIVHVKGPWQTKRQMSFYVSLLSQKHKRQEWTYVEPRFHFSNLIWVSSTLETNYTNNKDMEMFYMWAKYGLHVYLSFCLNQ